MGLIEGGAISMVVFVVHEDGIFSIESRSGCDQFRGDLNATGSHWAGVVPQACAECYE